MYLYSMKKCLVVCIGAALIDESYRCDSQPLQGTSNPAILKRSAGGVARNIAHHLAILGHDVQLISHFGHDDDGKWLSRQCASAGIRLDHSLFGEATTGKFVALLNPQGDLFAGAVSTHFEKLITPSFLSTKRGFLLQASLLLFDCNLSAESLDWLIAFSRESNIPCIIEPVSVPKASRLHKANLNGVLLITPNHNEMTAILGTKRTDNEQIKTLLSSGLTSLWVRKGKDGSVFHTQNMNFTLAAPEVLVKDSTGAGDAALAGWIHAWLNKQHPEDCVRFGHAMAQLVLQVEGAIRQDLTQILLDESFNKNQKNER